MTEKKASNLDPEPDPRDSPDTPEDNEPDTVATPEGDAEYRVVACAPVPNA